MEIKHHILLNKEETEIIELIQKLYGALVRNKIHSENPAIFNCKINQIDCNFCPFWTKNHNCCVKALLNDITDVAEGAKHV